MCLHCHESLRCRVLSTTATGKFRRDGIAVWIPAGNSNRFLDGLWHVVLHVALQHCVESLERNSNSNWIDIRDNEHMVSGGRLNT